MKAILSAPPAATGAPPARAAPPPIVLTSDEAFAMPLATTMRSLVDAHPGQPLEFHVFSNGFAPATRARIVASLPAGAATLHWVSVDVGDYAGFAAWERSTRMNYARFLIPRFFPATTERVLYLDPDLIVLGDLQPLWAAELGDAVVGAVRDAIVEPLLRAGQLPDGSVPRVRDYFNAGVLLINLPRWREAGISERAMAYLARHPQSFFTDQDALNFACDGCWQELPAHWNFQRHREGPIAALPPAERPRIVHFVTNEKPWNAAKLSANAAFYDSFRGRTTFARTRRERVTDAVTTGWTRLKRWTEAHVTGPRAWAVLRRTGRTLARRPSPS